jgi:hypothetical protein
LRLLQITAPHFCAGAVFHVHNGAWVCSQAAPILRYMVGWDSARVKSYCDRKGWRYVLCG